MRRIEGNGALRILMRELHEKLYKLYEEKPEPYLYNKYYPGMGLKLSLLDLVEILELPKDRIGLIGVALDRLKREGAVHVVKIGKRARWIVHVKPPKC